jgi:molybdenum cofactor cytidylyltransferase
MAAKMKTVGGLLLAAGRSSQVAGGYHKLLAEFGGIPLVLLSTYLRG